MLIRCTSERAGLALLLTLAIAGCGDKPQPVPDNGGATTDAGNQSGAGGAAAEAPEFSPPRLTSAPDADPHRHALLIGCNEYPNLPEKFHLQGPINDVLLMQKVLVERFRFPVENVVLLADALGDAKRPTRANIQRQWQMLADIATPESQIAVLMAGHGTRAPDVKTGESDDLEPDGLDEVFLPCDVGSWDKRVGEVENGIRDDELRMWIQAINDKGASLWIVVDACHSGTMTRDVGDEVKRELPSDVLGVPDEAIEQACAAAENRGASAADDGVQLIHADQERSRSVDAAAPADGQPVLLALYAAQSIEPTVETEMPRRGGQRKYFGLLTYTLCEVLSQAESELTYRELLERIQRKYVEAGRTAPTPMLEGNSLDREVLGMKTFARPSRIRIVDDGRRGWKITEGELAGLTAGSILAVYPPAGEPDADRLLGHVRILDDGLGPFAAQVEPHTYNGLAPPEKLAAGMRCETVSQQLSDQRLRVCADTHTDDGQRVPDGLRDNLTADLQQFARAHQHLVEAVDDPADADWLLRYNSLAARERFLTPVSGWSGASKGRRPPLFGPAEEGDAFPHWLEESLGKIARVQIILKIAGSVGSSSGTPRTGLQVEIIRYQDNRGEVVPFGRAGIDLYNGDQVAFQVKNGGKRPLDVTLLFISNSYAIIPLFPYPAGTSPRLFAGDKILVPDDLSGRIESDTTGLEHLIAIGVQTGASAGFSDFSFLQQSQIDHVRNLTDSSSLEQLFTHSLFGAGEAKRSFTRSEAARFEVRTLSWTTHAETRPE